MVNSASIDALKRLRQDQKDAPVADDIQNKKPSSRDAPKPTSADQILRTVNP